MMKVPNFESIKQVNILGVEYWSARDLMEALGYVYWQNFEKVIKKAITAATSSEINLTLEDHFSDVTKMITLGKGGKRKVKDYFLSKRACYLIARAPVWGISISEVTDLFSCGNGECSVPYS